MVDFSFLPGARSAQADYLTFKYITGKMELQEENGLEATSLLLSLVLRPSQVTRDKGKWQGTIVANLN